MNEDKLKKAYDSAKKHYKMPDFNTFKADMMDESKLAKFRESLAVHYSVPDFDTFKADMGFVKKKEETIASTSKPKTTSTTSEGGPQKSVRSGVTSGSTKTKPKTKASDFKVPEPEFKWEEAPKVESKPKLTPKQELEQKAFEDKFIAAESQVTNSPNRIAAVTPKKEDKEKNSIESQFSPSLRKAEAKHDEIYEKVKERQKNELSFINEDLMAMNEGAVVSELRKKVGPDFIFDEIGAGDKMLVTSKDGNYQMAFQLDQGNPDLAKKEAERLKTFLVENKKNAASDEYFASIERSQAIQTERNTTREEKTIQFEKELDIDPRLAPVKGLTYAPDKYTPELRYKDEFEFTLDDKAKLTAESKIQQKYMGVKLSDLSKKIANAKTSKDEAAVKEEMRLTVGAMSPAVQGKYQANIARELNNNSQAMKDFQKQSYEIAKEEAIVRDSIEKNGGVITEENQKTLDKISLDKDILNVHKTKLLMDSNDLSLAMNDIYESAGHIAVQKELEGTTGGIITNSFIKGATATARLLGASRETQEALIKYMGDPTTTKEYMTSEDRSMLDQVLMSVSESVGALAGGGGVPLATGAGFFAQSYFNIMDEMDDNPEFDNVSDTEKQTLGVLYGSTIGMLERFGVLKAFSKTPVKDKITKYVLSNVFRVMPKGATTEVFENVLENNIKAMLANGLLQIGGSSAIEFSTEAVQSLAEISLKETFDSLKGNDYFENDTTFGGIVSNMLISGALGSAGGGVMGTVAQSTQIVKKGFGSIKNNRELANTIRDISGDANFRSATVNYFKTQVMSGKMTHEDAKEALVSYDEMMGRMSKIPSDIKDVASAFDLITERSNLEKEIEGKDKALSSLKIERINEINEELAKLTKQDTVKEEVKVEVKEEVNKKGVVASAEYANSEVERVKQLPIENEDGATMNLNGSKYKDGGLVIPLASKNMKSSDLTSEAIDTFIDENSESIEADNVKVGIYKFPNSDQVSIDINIVADRSMREEALAIGKELGQESLFDLDTFENIKTGADGKNPKNLTAQEFKDIQKRLSKPVKTTKASTVQDVKKPDTVETLKDRFIAENDNVKAETLRASQNVVKSLSEVSGVKVFVHNTTDEYNEGIARSIGDTKENIAKEAIGSRGEYHPETKEIHINLEEAGPNTVYHEAFHAVVKEKGFTSEDMSGFVSAVKKSGNLSKEAVQKLDDFSSQYEKGEVDEEFLSELVGDLAASAETMDRTQLQKLIDAINKLFSKIGIEAPFTGRADRKQVVDLLNGIATSLRKGEVISDVVSKIDKKESIENTYVETNGSVKSTASNRKAQIVNTVVSKDDLVDPASLEGKPLEIVYYDNFTSSNYSLTNRVSGTSIERNGEGGPGYSYRQEIKDAGVIAAFTNVTKGLNLIQGISSRNNVAGENAVIGVALQNKETGHLGNKTTLRDIYNPEDGEIARAVSDGIISEKKAVEMLKQAVKAYESTKKGQDDASALGFAPSDFNSVKEFYDLMDAISFERRGTFNQIVIPTKSDLKITKSTKPHVKTWLKSGIPTLSDYYSATTEAYTSEAKSHDIVKYLDPNLTKVGVASSIEVTEAERSRAKEMGVDIVSISDDIAHTSYPVVLFGDNIGVPSTFHSVRDMAKDWNVPNPFFKAGRRKDTASPVRIPKIDKNESTPKVTPSRKKQLIPKKVDDRLTDDGKGNYVFHHYANTRKETLKPSLTTGAGTQTSKEERSAINSVGGVVMFYTEGNQKESFTGNELHTILIPKDKLYPLQQDPMGFYEEAKKQFKDKMGSQAFNPNMQAAWIGKVAEENGYKGLITPWKDGYRVQTTKEVVPEAKNIQMKQPIIENETYNVGDIITVYGTEAKVTKVDGNLVTFEGDGTKGTINVSNNKSIRKKSILKKKRDDNNDINELVNQKKIEGKTDKEIRSELKDLMYTDKEATSAINKYNLENEGIWVNTGNKILDSLASFKKRYLSARRFLPKSVFNARENKDADIALHLQMTEKNTRDFNKLVKKFNGNKEQVVRDFDAYVRGDKSIELPNEFLMVANSMRNHVDALSQSLIDSGVVNEYQAQTIKDNLGQYLTRSYKVFDRKAWKDEVSEEVVQKAKNVLRQQYLSIAKDKSKKENIPVDEALETIVNNKLTEMLNKGEASKFVKGSKSGSKDLSVLSERTDIPVEIRALMGEYKDPGLNYAKTVLKLSALAANHKYLVKTRNNGVGVFLFEENDPRRPEAYNTKIAAEGSKTMAPLNGLYTTKEIAAEFEAQQKDLGKFLELYMKVISAVKWSKTIGSLATHAKNITGNLGFVWLNGHSDLSEMRGAYSTVMNDFKSKDKKNYRDRMNKYISLGIVKQSAGLGEIMDMFKDANYDIALASRLSNKDLNPLQKAKKILFQGKKALEDAYQAEDDFFKIVAYENELSRYSKAMFGKDKADLTESERSEVDNVVAEIVKNTYPTYSRVPEAIQLIRRFPLVGNFISFQAESYRTAINTAVLAREEITSENPEIRKIGVKRIAGAVTYMSAKTAILSYFSMAAGTGLVGIAGMFDDEEEKTKDKDIRMFVPDWSKKSDLLMLNAGNGKIKYIDFSASDPHGAIHKVINAALLEDDPVSAFIEGAREVYEPFLGVEITTKALFNLARNLDNYDRPIYKTTDSSAEKIAKMTAYILKVAEPGTVTTIKRAVKSGDKVSEIISAATGFRVMEVSVTDQFGFLVKETTDRLSDAKSDYNKAYRDFEDGKISKEELDKAYKNASKKQRDILEEVVDIYNSAERLGSKREDLDAALKSYANIPKYRVEEIRNGKIEDIRTKDRKVDVDKILQKYM